MGTTHYRRKQVETMWSLYDLSYEVGALTVTIKDATGTSTKTVLLNRSQATRTLAPGVVEDIDRSIHSLDEQWERFERWRHGK
jgi:hypothetical protein